MDGKRYNFSGISLPPGGGQPAPEQDRYADLRGQVVVDLPLRQPKKTAFPNLKLPPGRGINADATFESMKVSEIGPHIAEQVRRGLRVSPDEGANTLAWATGSLKGANLLDARTIGQMEKLSSGLAAAGDSAGYFAKEVQPFLNGLTPQKRGNDD